MPIETLEYPTQRKVYTWRCCNNECNALLRGFKDDCHAKVLTKHGNTFEFRCPHCKWHTTVPE